MELLVVSSQQWLEHTADILLSSRPSLIDWGSVAVNCFLASWLPGGFLLQRFLYPDRYDYIPWRAAYIIAGCLFVFMLVTFILGWS